MLNASQSLLHPDQYRFGIKSPVLLYLSDFSITQALQFQSQLNNLQRFQCQSTIQLETAFL